jgi:hypothetical protein
MIRKDIREKIVAQANNEIIHARNYKQRRVFSWFKNENMYYGLKNRKLDQYGNIIYDPNGSNESRANVELGKMQEFVHTLLSKIDNPLTFKYVKKKNADYKKALRANAIKNLDQNADDWDMKDLLGKKQAVMYGRAIYAYHAESLSGYKSCLENIDVYDFLIDPSCGGIDIEKAWYMGRYGIIKSKEELKQGVKGKLYMQDEVKKLTQGAGNNTEITQEESNKENREIATGTNTTQRELMNPDKYKFWEWFTTFEGKRYYILMTESGVAIRLEELKDLFASDKFPFWTWAAFPDLTEFWTPSYCDYVREIFMAQSVSINQMMDNAEQVNKPQKGIDVTAIKDQKELKYRKDGIIRFKGGTDVNKAIQILAVPSINTPLEVYDKLETIQEKASGVTGSAKGVAEEERVAIYEGNQMATADRFGLLNKSYAHGYKRFATLHYEGIKEHLRKKLAVELIGPEGVETEEITKKDIIPSAGEFSIMVEASNAEINISSLEKQNRLAFYNSQITNPLVNQKKLFELTATDMNIDQDNIRALLDRDSYGSIDLLSEADRDLEEILNGRMPQPNMMANIAYVQKLVDYAKNEREFLDEEQFTMILQYVDILQPIVQENMVSYAIQQQMQQQQMAASQPIDPEAVVENPEANPNIAPVEQMEQFNRSIT